MNSSKRRHDGGAYRQYKTMMTAHAKEGKDRSKANRKQPKRKLKKALVYKWGTGTLYTQDMEPIASGRIL